MCIYIIIVIQWLESQKRQLIHREVIENLVKIGLCKYIGHRMQVDLKVWNILQFLDTNITIYTFQNYTHNNI